MSHRIFVKGLKNKTIEGNMKLIYSYIENSPIITDGDKHFLKCKIYEFFKIKRYEIKAEFKEAKLYNDYFKIRYATKFASRFISDFIENYRLSNRVLDFLMQLFQELDNSEENLLWAYETRTCPICGYKFEKRWLLQSCGALMILNKYTYHCPNGH